MILAIAIVFGGVVAAQVQAQRGRTASTVARASTTAVATTLEAYHADHGTYVGATPATLASDYRLDVDGTLRLERVEAASYCAEVTYLGRTWSQEGPASRPAETPC